MELAEQARIGRTTIAEFETGRRDMSLEMFSRVAAVLELDVSVTETLTATAN